MGGQRFEYRSAVMVPLNSDDIFLVKPAAANPLRCFNDEDLRVALDAMPVAVSWSYLVDQVILCRNPAFQRLFGYESTRFETVGKWIQATYPFAEDRSLGWERWGSWLTAPPESEMSIEPVEVRILCQNGAIKTILQSVVILPEIGRVMATFTEACKPAQRKSRPSSSERKAQEADAVYRMLAATGHPEDAELVHL